MKVTITTIRVAPGHDGEDGKQQHVGQLVEFALRPARIGNLFQQVQQRRECSHGNLQILLPPHDCPVGGVHLGRSHLTSQSLFE